MTLAFLFLLFIFGLAVGSFLGAYTYRLPRDKSIKDGRSFCPHCKKKISWFDNIPLLSFFLLKGECRDCGKKISWREPAIELATGLGFAGIALALNYCATTFQGLPFKGEVICSWKELLGPFALPYLLLAISVLIAILVIDLENQLIPDDLVYVLFFLTLLSLVISSSPNLFPHISVAFAAASFLLLIHLVTRGRGMGLGDVKLALPAGLVLGWPGTLVWLYLAFLIGAIIGIVLIVLKKAEFGKHIPFGPFLVISLLITLVIGNRLSGFFSSVF